MNTRGRVVYASGIAITYQGHVCYAVRTSILSDDFGANITSLLQRLEIVMTMFLLFWLYQSDLISISRAEKVLRTIKNVHFIDKVLSDRYRRREIALSKCEVVFAAHGRHASSHLPTHHACSSHSVRGSSTCNLRGGTKNASI